VRTNYGFGGTTANDIVRSCCPRKPPTRSVVVYTEMLSGNAEYYYNQNYPGVNISVRKDIGKIPTHSELEEYCIALERMFKKMLGKTAKVNECKLMNVAGLGMWYNVIYIRGILTIQCAVQKSPSVQITLTTSTEPYGNKIYKIIKEEFEEIMESFKLKGKIGQ